MRRVLAQQLSHTMFLTLAGRDDPLPSWRSGPSKRAIMSFVADAMRIGSPHFEPQAEPVADVD